MLDLSANLLQNWPTCPPLILGIVDQYQAYRSQRSTPTAGYSPIDEKIMIKDNGTTTFLGERFLCLMAGHPVQDSGEELDGAAGFTAWALSCESAPLNDTLVEGLLSRIPLLSQSYSPSGLFLKVPRKETRPTMGSAA